MVRASDNKDSWDVVVVGSGAGGLAAAVAAAKLGLDVLVIEKEPLFGGTTARSGGVLWVPGNPVSARAGVRDDVAGARTYIRALAGAAFAPARVEAFLREGARMVDFFERETAVKFIAQPEFPDYRAGIPGAASGRSIVAAPLDGRELGPQVHALRPPLREITFVGMMFNASEEVRQFFRATRSLKSAIYVVKRLVTHAGEMIRYRRAMRLTNGNALAARLAKSAFDLAVPIWVCTPLRKLVTENGAVTGVLVETSRGPRRLSARLGVVLAGGGFPHDRDRQRRLFPHVKRGGEHLSPASPGNTGDTLRAAVDVGGTVEETLSSPAAWIPVSRVPRRNKSGVFPHLIDRYKPGVIAVDANGRRFVNEADSYHEVGNAMLAVAGEAAEPHAWLICDHRALRRYGIGYVKPFPLPIRPHLKSGYLRRGRTLAELARAIGVDPATLQSTVARFNCDAERGTDAEFGRGQSAYNRYLGDAEHRPNPCVAPLASAPFYAVRMVMGDLGTFAGLRTDEHSRVLDGNAAPIPGLYAAGNDMASIMGGSYPGGGITLGPAMTFGFIAAQSLAQRRIEAEQGSRMGDARSPSVAGATERGAQSRRRAVEHQ